MAAVVAGTVYPVVSSRFILVIVLLSSCMLLLVPWLILYGNYFRRNPPLPQTEV